MECESKRRGRQAGREYLQTLPTHLPQQLLHVDESMSIQHQSNTRYSDVL